VTIKNTSDNKLIHAFQHGEAGAFKTLYARYKNRAFFYALAFQGDAHAAEEAVQEAFMTFLERISTYRPEGSFQHYLFSTVRCRVIDGLRKEGTRREILPGQNLDLFENAKEQSSFQKGELGRLVSRALLSLPPEQREVVALKVFDDMTFSDISQVVGISENTAASRYRYALEKLKLKLEGILKNG
jgi:RNA polymerase sigma-70 factor (ECF subfamily)